VKGFGGGFAGRCATAFGEPEMKAFVRHTEAAADALATALSTLDCEMRVALTHYAPVPDTLAGEPPEIYPFLGSYLMGRRSTTTTSRSPSMGTRITAPSMVRRRVACRSATWPTP